MKLNEVAEPLDVTRSNLSDSNFNDVNLANARFENVNLSGSLLQNVNLSGVRISNANLNELAITDAALAGTTINGILVTDLLAAHEAIQVLANRTTTTVEDIN
jgi:uncharacterized protein YjbI with pentapeptide repeats